MGLRADSPSAQAEMSGFSAMALHASCHRWCMSTRSENTKDCILTGHKLIEEIDWCCNHTNSIHDSANNVSQLADGRFL